MRRKPRPRYVPEWASRPHSRAAEHRRALRAYERMVDLVRNRPMDAWAEHDRQLYLSLIYAAKMREAIAYRESQLTTRAAPPLSSNWRLD